MKVSNKNTTNKKIVPIVVISAVLILILGALYVFVVRGYAPWSDGQDQNQSPTQEQIDSANTTKQETIEGSDASSSSSKNPQTDNQPSRNDIKASIPYADASRITVLIEGVLEGTCTLTLSNGSNTTTQTVDIQAGPSSSTCKGFSFNPALTSGSWRASVSVTAGTLTGSAEKVIEVR